LIVSFLFFGGTTLVGMPNPVLDAIQDDSSLADLRAAIASGANIDQQDENMSTPLLYAVEFNKLEFAQELLAAGANPNILNNYDRSPFLEALEFNKVEMVRVLKDSGRLDQQTVQAVIDCLFLIASKNGLSPEQQEILNILTGPQLW